MVKKDGLTIPGWVLRLPITWIFVVGGLSAIGIGGFSLAKDSAPDIQVKVATNEANIHAMKDDIREIKMMLRDMTRKAK